MHRGCAIAAAVLACAACGGGKTTRSIPHTSGTDSATVPTILGCLYLLPRLERATLAIRSSSELVARSASKRQLAHRIAIEQIQLERAAALVATGPTPAALVPATQRLAAALHALSLDFGKAKVPAAVGNFPAAAKLMTDRPVQLAIVRESQAIEKGCR